MYIVRFTVDSVHYRLPYFTKRMRMVVRHGFGGFSFEFLQQARN